MYRSGMIREADDVCICYLSSQQWFWIDKIRTTKFTWPKLIVKLMKLRRRTHFWQWAKTYLRASETWKKKFFFCHLFTSFFPISCHQISNVWDLLFHQDLWKIIKNLIYKFISDAYTSQAQFFSSLRSSVTLHFDIFFINSNLHYARKLFHEVRPWTWIGN